MRFRGICCLHCSRFNLWLLKLVLRQFIYCLYVWMKRWVWPSPHVERCCLNLCALLCCVHREGQTCRLNLSSSAGALDAQPCKSAPVVCEACQSRSQSKWIDQEMPLLGDVVLSECEASQPRSYGEKMSHELENALLGNTKEWEVRCLLSCITEHYHSHSLEWNDSTFFFCEFSTNRAENDGQSL